MLYEVITNRKVYSLTDAGRSELGDWISSPEAMFELRDTALIKLFFSELSGTVITSYSIHYTKLYDGPRTC